MDAAGMDAAHAQAQILALAEGRCRSEFPPRTCKWLHKIVGEDGLGPPALFGVHDAALTALQIGGKTAGCE